MDTQESETPKKVQDVSVRPTIWWLMLRVLVAPASAFGYVKAFPRWLIPCILCIIVLLAQEVLIQPQTLNDMKETIQNSTSLSQTEVQKRLEMIDFQLVHGTPEVMLVKGLVLLTFIHLSKVFGTASLIWLALQFMSAGATYRQTVSISSLAFLAVVPESIIKVPTVLARESTRVYFGLAVLIPADLYETAIFRILRDLDIFTIWIACLIAIGVSIGLGVPRRHAYFLVGGLLGCRVLMSFLNIVLVGTS